MDAFVVCTCVVSVSYWCVNVCGRKNERDKENLLRLLWCIARLVCRLSLCIFLVAFVFVCQVVFVFGVNTPETSEKL